MRCSRLQPPPPVCSMSLIDGDRVDSAMTNHNNNVLKAEVVSSLKQSDAFENRKSPVMVALEQEEQEPSLYKGGRIQSRSFKMLEQELHDGVTRDSVMSKTTGPVIKRHFTLITTYFSMVVDSIWAPSRTSSSWHYSAWQQQFKVHHKQPHWT